MCPKMVSWTNDQLVAATIVLGTMIFAMLLALFYTLLKAGKLDKVLDKLIRIGHFLVPKSSPLGQRIHFSEVQNLTGGQQQRRSRGRRALKQGKSRELDLKISKQCREQLHKVWIDSHRHIEEMCTRAHATNQGKTSHRGYPGEKLTQKPISFFWFDRKELATSRKAQHFGNQHTRAQISPLLKYILRGKLVKQDQPVCCLPETQLTQGHEKHGFGCGELNDVDQGLKHKAAKAGQYHYVTRGPGWLSRECNHISLPEDIV